MMTSRISGAPICAGEASPLRVATGGSANWSSGVRSRRSPARTNERRDNVCSASEDASLFQSSENHGKKLTHIGHLFMTNPRASLRSDDCPISIGMGVRFGLEQVSAFVGIRIVSGQGTIAPLLQPPSDPSQPTNTSTNIVSGQGTIVPLLRPPLDPSQPTNTPLLQAP
jgi:hypothetical protein